MNKKEKIKQFIPPIIVNILQNYRRRKHGWFGNYKSWSEASQDCTGYDSDIIIEKCKSSLLKVKNGEAVYERDSVLFDKIEYSWPVLTALLKSVQQNSGKLHVLDFGGSLGSSYFQNRTFLNDINDFSWNVVEQKHFVTTGQKFFKDARLNFYETIEACFKEKKPSVLLLSNVLQYLENTEKMIDYFLSFNFDYIVIDLISVFDFENRITIQKVQPEIYEASYPCWIFNEKQLLSNFLKTHYLVADFDSYFGEGSRCEEDSFKFRGYILKRKVQ